MQWAFQRSRAHLALDRYNAVRAKTALARCLTRPRTLLARPFLRRIFGQHVPKDFQQESTSKKGSGLVITLAERFILKKIERYRMRYPFDVGDLAV